MWVTVSQRMYSERSPSACGQSSRCQWLGMTQKASKRHRLPGVGLAEDLEEGGVVGGLGEEGVTANGPVKDVIDETSLGSAKASGHDGS